MNVLSERKSGVLMHISSLPGDFGIGTFGKQAFAFVDYLKACKQSYWQILPLGPTGYGDSPYQSFSTFAGNPYFIDLDLLEEASYLKKNDYKKIFWGNSDRVDFGLIYTERKKIFSILYENFKNMIPSDFESFCKENSFWLDDYALFMALKDAYEGKAFSEWEESIRKREKSAVEEWAERLSSQIEYYKMLQYFFYQQWNNVKNYANSQGIKIIGDIPIYVASDSSDVWSNPEIFVLDGNLYPIEVAGCPPDVFSQTGQLWGNPVYNWDVLKKSSYGWWKKRIKMSLKFYDIIRIDHFRGFDSYYCIPYGNKTAENGQWRKGPGIDLFLEFQKEFGDVPIIAEDLGILTDSVIKLLKDSGFPGMKVLQFAFDPSGKSDYMPYRHIKNSVVYTGTHDNDTILGWCESASDGEVAFAKKYYEITGEKWKDNLRKKMLLSALSSVSNTCILCMQDLIGLDSTARMNRPSSVGENWKWRAKKSMFNKKIPAFLSYYTELYGRN